MTNPTKLFPLVVTKDLDRTRRCYEALGFDISVDMPDYLQFRYGSDDSAPEIAFMREGSGPHPAFGGQGLIVSIPTEDADEKHAAASQADVDVVGEPADRPWGWRSFHVKDPSGVVLDFFHVQRNR